MKDMVKVSALLSLLLVIDTLAFALYTVYPLAKEGQPIPKHYAELRQWPEGVLSLVNDPLRTLAWMSLSSMMPDDVSRFAFTLGKTGDVDHLVRRLAAIEAKKIQVVLDPGEGPMDPWSTGGKRLQGASFAIGDQRVIDKWFNRLPEVEPGVRAFGVHRYQSPPTALPPTLALHVDNEFVVLEKLEVPPEVIVEASPRWEWNAERMEWEGPPRDVERFVQQHRAKRRTAATARGK